MKRLLLLISFAFFLSCVGPVAATAQDPQSGPTVQKTKSRWSLFHRGKRHREKSESSPTYHKSAGSRLHPGPGRSGAVADQKANSKRSFFHREKQRPETTGPLYSVPKSVGGRHPTPGPVGAGAN